MVPISVTTYIMMEYSAAAPQQPSTKNLTSVWGHSISNKNLTGGIRLQICKIG